MFHWETHVSLGVLLVLIIVIIVPRSVFTKSSSIELYEEDKRLLFDSDPWPPAEQKLEMPCDTCVVRMLSLSNFTSFHETFRCADRGQLTLRKQFLIRKELFLI